VSEACPTNYTTLAMEYIVVLVTSDLASAPKVHWQAGAGAPARCLLSQPRVCEYLTSGSRSLPPPGRGAPSAAALPQAAGGRLLPVRDELKQQR
jgi:hypothetical protein